MNTDERYKGGLTPEILSLHSAMNEELAKTHGQKSRTVRPHVRRSNHPVNAHVPHQGKKECARRLRNKAA